MNLNRRRLPGLSKRLKPGKENAEYRELDSKIKEFVKSGSFDQISQTVADYVTRKIEQNLAKKKTND